MAQAVIQADLQEFTNLVAIGDLDQAGEGQVALQAAVEGYLENFDNGPEVFNCTSYSSVFIKDGIKKIGKNIYLQAYFDNENSVNRYYDLVSYISNCILKGK